MHSLLLFFYSAIKEHYYIITIFNIILFFADIIRESPFPAIRPIDTTRLTIIDLAADVRREEHDGRVRPSQRPLPHRGHHLPRTNVHEGGGRTDAQCPEQELAVSATFPYMSCTNMNKMYNLIM